MGLNIIFNFERNADKFFSKHPDIRVKFINNIKKYFKGDRNIDIVSLQGHKDLLRMRIGKYRVIYKIVDGEIIIVSVIDANLRGDVYKNY